MSAAWLAADEAARRLRVSRATLYAYVSRGLIRSQAVPGTSRERAYAGDDVERLRRRTEERRHPDKAAAHALQWGMPILESSIALIDGRALYYRGHDAAALARTRSLEEVAALIWLGRLDARLATVRRANATIKAPPEEPGFAARAQVMLAREAARDPLAHDLRRDAVALCGWRLLHLLAAAATRTTRIAPTIDAALARTWSTTTGAEVLRRTLVLCADHELNVSSFTARCVASAGSSPYAVVAAGLAALEGTRHGGAGARVESMLASLRRESRLRSALAARLRRGEPVEGFGHPLYPAGDPRARTILAQLQEAYPRSAELAFALAFADAAADTVREQPNLDFALATVARVLRLPPESPLMLFAIGRTIGWIGHAIEQYETGQLIRPRAKYVGVVPQAAD
jgi:citrate synthase